MIIFITLVLTGAILYMLLTYFLICMIEKDRDKNYIPIKWIKEQAKKNPGMKHAVLTMMLEEWYKYFKQKL